MSISLKKSYADIANLYVSGLSTTEIAKKYNTSHTSIRYALKKMNVSMRGISETKTGFAILDVKDEFVQLYNDGSSFAEIAKMYGVSKSYVMNNIKGLVLPRTCSHTKLGIDLDLYKEDIIKEYNNGKSSIEIGESFGVSYQQIINILKKNSIELKHSRDYPSQISKFEKEICDFVSQFVDVEIKNRSVLNGKEIDIYIPSKNLAIECNGIYWHSELAGKTREYHLKKFEGCHNAGIKLLTIFENEWIYKKNIVKSIIKNYLGVSDTKYYARKCEIRSVSQKEEKEFCNTNHIQGYVKSKKCLGLYFDNILVMLFSIGTPRFDKNADFEILRISTILNSNVIGGLSKLWKAFNFDETQSIISYADNRYFTGQTLTTLGFTFSKKTKPNYWYFLRGQTTLYNRMNYQKHKLHKKLNVYDEKISEWDNMIMNGYNRIWDCGNTKWIKEGYKTT